MADAHCGIYSRGLGDRFMNIDTPDISLEMYADMQHDIEDALEKTRELAQWVCIDDIPVFDEWGFQEWWATHHIFYNLRNINTDQYIASGDVNQVIEDFWFRSVDLRFIG